MNDTGTEVLFRAETVPMTVCGNRGGYIYFVTDGEAIKIGFSEAPQLRLANLQTSSPRELSIRSDRVG